MLPHAKYRSAGSSRQRSARSGLPVERSAQSDTRSHLNLQIDLLAKREMTAVLQLLHDIARNREVETTVTPEQLRDLAKNTDVRRLTDRMEEITEPPPGALPPASAMGT